MKIGFIGLGIMGAPMAQHLVDAGHSLHFSTLGNVPDSLTDAGAKACATPADVTVHADVIIIMVPDTADVAAVLFGENGCASVSLKGKTIVDMSSISPIETKMFAQRVQQLGGHYLDAPVSGGEIGAQQGTLTIMVGGEEAVFNDILPLFELMGKNITRVGECGDGQTCKVANQIIVALNIEAVSEALLFASRAGADPARVRQALMGGFASSRILEVHGERMIKRTFAPGFKVALHQKDLNLALQSAKALSISLPNTATCQELFNVCAANGGSQLDHSSLIQSLEMMSNHKIA
ncbi:2-hydroxy-3-oxopropionate reductase [Rahnella sp. SL6]|uniref:2-hydroxy-3-oxopropionate reductase n=1 Tax=Rahnella perminowiae TaxID=2816244 RepID=UPI001C27E9AE|nr:2-hydroxy-3-oxopropionate reductase [Rahnella perminowiae]MBU9810913.1 2-hydroxy-3-oxopropionate reductase [Rahnella perminowiae]